MNYQNSYMAIRQRCMPLGVVALMSGISCVALPCLHVEALNRTLKTVYNSDEYSGALIYITNCLYFCQSSNSILKLNAKLQIFDRLVYIA